MQHLLNSSSLPVQRCMYLCCIYISYLVLLVLHMFMMTCIHVFMMFSTGLAGGCLSAGGGRNLTCTYIYIYGQYFPAYAYVLGACNNCVHHLQLDLRCELSDIPLFSAGGLGRPCEKFLACISLCFSVCCA